MNIRHYFARGFSLIEVLIAVAVLSFGLLALASLQASMIRASAESKAQSVGLSLAKDQAEDLRAYRTSADYAALADGVRTVAGVGGVDYTVTTTVNRYAVNVATGAFDPVADTGALPATHVAENEFKKISVSVGWTDANNDPQTIVIEDAIGSLPPENTGRLARRKKPPQNRGPEILISNPASDPGVIPIAIGQGSETAATNPRPEVDTGISLQTSYDIFTYAALNASTARAQSRVETVIIGCRCDTTEAIASQLNFRPTYWDGERYIVPKEAPGNSRAGEADLQNNDPSQSILCNACCRDHHDPAGVSGPKFSPRRDLHKHFLDDLSTEVTSGEYFEACRSIRVDGIHRIAADPYNEYLNTLKTAVASGETEPFTSPAPDGTANSGAQQAYVNFVIDYLRTQALQPDPNSQLAQGVGDGKAQTAGLNDPVQNVAEGDVRWMHARGLYIDWLEAEALAELDDSQDTDECPQPGPLTLTQCLLRVLPFTSINVTELSDWTPTAAANEPIHVANNDFVTSGASADPVRGRVTAASVGDAPATVTLRTSNTGLLAHPEYHIDLADDGDDSLPQANNIDDQPDDDAQGFSIAGPRCGGAATLTLRGGDSGAVESSASCDGSDVTKPTSETQVRVRITFGAGPTNATIVLLGPDNTPGDDTDNPRYPVFTNQAWPAPVGTAITYTFAALGDPDVAGIWKLLITNEDNGPDDTVKVAFAVDFLYTATFQTGLSGYTIVGSTTPSLSVSPGGVCNSLAASNPATCSTTAPGAAHVIRLGAYNYLATDTAAQTVACTKPNGNPVSCVFPITGPPAKYANRCRNFNVDSATVGVAATPATSIVASTPDGATLENTAISFASIADGDLVTITMSLTADPLATCSVPSNGNCSLATWTCQ